MSIIEEAYDAPHGVNVASPQDWHFEALTPNVKVYRGGSLGDNEGARVEPS